MSGTHWSLVLFDPNQHQLWLIDPSFGNEPDANIISFFNKMRSHLNIADVRTIRRYPNNPPMEISGDCGMYVVEYVRVVLQAIRANCRANPLTDFYFQAEPFFLRDGKDGIHRAREEWMQIIRRLSDQNIE